MKRTAITFLCLAFSSSLLFAQTKSDAAAREVRTANGARAVVLPAGKAGTQSHNESRIDIYTAKGDKVCSLDLSSDDGEHGYAVAKAAWTPDGNYLVYSLQSSGGHAPWHTPTLFVLMNFDRPVCLLDSYLDNPGITTSDFKLTAPDSVTTRVYGAKSDVTVSLSRITQSPVNGRSRCVRCEMAIPVKFLP
jgi:hypothetical protein